MTVNYSFEDIFKSADKSVLCWLATVSADLVPNVSPKEIFSLVDEDLLLIANIASPQSEQNILTNENVCVSFVDVFEQRGFKIIGKAKIIDASDPNWETYLAKLRELADERFPIKNIFAIQITQTAKIQAPSYFLFPDIKVEEQVKSALKVYGVSRE